MFRLMRTSLSATACVIALLSAAELNAQFGPSQQFQCESPGSVALSDVDGDGDLDLLVGSREGVGFYVNTDGQGTFAPPVFFGAEETVVCSADIDGDGDRDVIASKGDNGGIVMHLNDGTGVFQNAVILVAEVSATELLADDIDADGDQDILFAMANGTLNACLNTDGYGLFGAPVQVGNTVQLANVQLLDMNGDGGRDITFSSLVANTVFACFFNQGWFEQQEQISVSGHGVAGDIDSDGYQDVLVANTTAGSVGWQRNAIDEPGFDSPQFLDQAFSSPERTAVCDLDGDGDLDAVLTSAALDEVYWYKNTNGQGAFGPRQTICTGVPATGISTGDVDNDGDQDLFVASSSLNKVIQYTNLSTSTGMLTGRVFNDVNGDGIFNGSDHGLANMRVEAGDLGATYTNASGFYWYDAVPATYMVMKPAEDNWVFTTVDSYMATVPASGASMNNDFGLQAGGIISQLTPDIGSAPMRCGLDISYWATVTNTGNQVSDVRLDLTVDVLSNFVGAIPAPDAIENGTATWLFTNVQPTHQRLVNFIVHLPGSDFVGQTLNDVMQATALVNGDPLSTDTRTLASVLLCAVDPNDKQVAPAGEGQQHLTAMGSKIFYHVRFQNTGNAHASTVTILDTLDTDLDLSTLRMLNSSHTYRALLQTDGVLRITYDNINLPDSGSDFTASQGFVRFMIDHVQDLPEGTVLNNTADIYFDNNAPVITNTTLNTLTYGSVTAVAEEAAMGEGMQVFPNPAHGTATVRLSDDMLGRVDLQLFDLKGGLVQQVSRRSSTVVLERNGLPAGSYLLRAVDERGTERVARLAFE